MSDLPSPNNPQTQLWVRQWVPGIIPQSMQTQTPNASLTAMATERERFWLLFLTCGLFKKKGWDPLSVHPLLHVADTDLGQPEI
jgi:hypothetical protein